MKLILLENIKALGKKGDIKEVSDGYAINFLLPQQRAALATSLNINKEKNKINKKEETKQEVNNNYDKIIKVLNNTTISFRAKASDKEHLFKSVSKQDIIKYVKDNFNLILNEKWFNFNKGLKSLGKFPLSLNLPNKKRLNIFIEIKEK